MLVFDSSTDQQLGQLWVSREEVVARIGEDALKAEVRLVCEPCYFYLIAANYCEDSHLRSFIKKNRPKNEL